MELGCILTLLEKDCLQGYNSGEGFPQNITWCFPTYKGAYITNIQSLDGEAKLLATSLEHPL